MTATTTTRRATLPVTEGQPVAQTMGTLQNPTGYRAAIMNRWGTNIWTGGTYRDAFEAWTVAHTHRWGALPG